MSNYKLLLSDDINCQNIYNYLCENLKHKETLFLTATQNLKRLRLQNQTFESNDKINIKTFSELKENVYDQIRDKGRFISRADQKFILTQVIRQLFSGERQIAFYKIRNDLFELYEFLLSEEVGEISQDIIELVNKDFTNTEADIFKIYNNYYNALYDIKNGQVPKNIDVERLHIGTHAKLLSEIFNETIFNQVDDYNTIVFDGFLFFNEEQRKVLLDAIIKKKDIIFIAKTMKADKSNFLLDQLFRPIEEEFNIKLEIVKIDSNNKEPVNAISFVKNNYLDFSKNSPVAIDDGFKFIDPFASRDKELNYIINCITKYLKSKGNDDKATISKLLSQDIAIVIANDKEKYEHQLNVLLKENGVFFLDTNSELLDSIDESCLKPILYRRNEFIEARIRYKSGKPLNRQEKIVAFRKLYKGINISQKSRSFINYPIGQYILEIYKIVNQGMSCEGFKKILYSNWYYNVGLDTVKYDKFIKEFHYVEPYLQHKSSPQDWLDELKNIKDVKHKLTNNIENRFNPLQDISFDSLDFLIGQVLDTRNIVDNLSKIFGDINQHLKALKENFLLDEIITNQNISDEFEIEVIKHLNEIIDKINKSNLITNIDSKYFSDNIRNMLTDYEREKAESSANELTLNVVNLENMQNFKLTFFCMLEEDKYPRQYTMSFPYTENIIEILSNPKYEIEHKPNFIKTLDYHIQLEKYLFLNVLDFTKEQMIITQTEEENGKELSNSIYIEDIFSMFKQDIKYFKLKDGSLKTDTQYTPKTRVDMTYNDNNIKLSDFCSFFICPKLYYYICNPEFANEISYNSEWQLNIFIPDLLFYKTLYKLGLEGKKNRKIYSLNNSDFINTVQKNLEEAFNEEINNFDFLSNYDKKDIITRTSLQLDAFIKRNIYDRDIVFFYFDLTDTQTFKIIDDYGEEKNISIDNCLKIRNIENGKSFNYDISSQMDFLVKSSGGETYPEFKHFKEIMDKLLEKSPFDDRMALVSYMFFKLNVQLNINDFKDDGLKKIKDSFRFIHRQSDSDYIASSYCRYCKFSQTCKMKERGSV